MTTTVGVWTLVALTIAFWGLLLLSGCATYPNALTPEQQIYCSRHPHESECRQGRL
jgi:hypothetical protein